MRALRLWTAAAALLAATAAARADSIDGNWCDGKGRQMSIQGTTIVTPGGTRMEGRYSRHGFAYVVPEREAPAGAAISMTLVTENTIRLRVGEAEPSQVWNRCEQTS